MIGFCTFKESRESLSLPDMNWIESLKQKWSWCRHTHTHTWTEGTNSKRCFSIKIQGRLLQTANITTLSKCVMPGWDLVNEENFPVAPSVSSDAAETQWGIGAAEAEWICEGYPSTPSLPLLRCAGNVIQVELGLCSVQVKGWGQDFVVTGQSGESCLQSPSSPEQMSCGPLGRGHSQDASTLLEKSLDGCIFCCVSQRCRCGVSIYICDISQRDICIF